MNIHEHQAKEILKKYGASVPNGVMGFSVDEIVEKAKKLNTQKYVLKAQIHAGGRGKAGGIKILDNIEPIKGAKELVETLHSCNIRTAIISGGIQYLADKWAQKWGIERALANELSDDGKGRLRAKINVRGNNKGPVMEKLMSQMNVEKSHVISVGDTVVDLPLFERSGYSIAVNTEDSRVIENADYHHRSINLSELIPIISKLAKH